MEDKIKKMDIENGVVEQLKQVYDPEIPVNIYDLGLIYEVNIDTEYNVHILMTLTAPNCPVAESLPAEVKEKAAQVEGAISAEVELTFEPPWTMELMSEEAKMELGFI